MFLLIALQIEIVITIIIILQGNKLKNSLSVDSSDVKGSSERVGSLIMDSVVPGSLKDEIAQRLGQSPYSDGFVAVRSSGTDEDSSAHSFAGDSKLYVFLITSELNKKK